MNTQFSTLPTGAIFDCDGTLADTMPLHYLAWCEAVQAHGLVFPEEQFYRLGGTPTRRIVEILAEEQGVEVDAEQVETEKETHFLEHLPHCQAIPEVVAAARYFLDAGIPIAVASGGAAHVVGLTLEGMGIRDWFKWVITPEQVTHGKPSPDSFLLAAKLMGTNPATCAVFEDSDTGEEAARAAGMMLVRVHSEGSLEKRTHRLERRF